MPAKIVNIDNRTANAKKRNNVIIPLHQLEWLFLKATGMRRAPYKLSEHVNLKL